MAIGKPTLPQGSYYAGDTDDAISRMFLSLDTLDKELALTPGSARIEVAAAVVAGQAVALVNGLLVPADAAGAVPAIGLCTRSATSAGQKASIILGMGLATGLTGLTVNASYYLGNAGAIVVGIPVLGMKQSIGYAISATELFVTISQPFA